MKKNQRITIIPVPSINARKKGTITEQCILNRERVEGRSTNNGTLLIFPLKYPSLSYCNSMIYIFLPIFFIFFLPYPDFMCILIVD